MTAARSVLAWIPSLVIGVTMATAAEVCGVLLLYSGPGLLRALSLILVVETGSAALGLWVATGVERPRVVDAIRRRWLFTLTVVSAATVTAVAWAVLGGFSDSRLGQGLGLAALGGLPLYAGGTLAGLVARPQAGLTPSTGSRWPGPGVVVVVGLAVGFLVTGALLRVQLSPASIFLGTIILLSAGALVHGRLLRPDPLVRKVEEIRSGGGVFRVEDRVARGSGDEARVLFVNGRVRGLEARGGDPLLADERRLLTMFSGDRGVGRALLLGTGAGTLVRELLGRNPDVRIDAVEENPEVLRLARDYFAAVPRIAEERVTLIEADPRRFEDFEAGGYDLVLVEASAVDRGRPVPRLSPDEARRLRELLTEGGTLVVFRLPDRTAAAESLAALLEVLEEWFPAAHLVDVADEVTPDLEAVGLEPRPSTVLVATLGDALAPLPTEGSEDSER